LPVVIILSVLSQCALNSTLKNGEKLQVWRWPVTIRSEERFKVTSIYILWAEAR